MRSVSKDKLIRIGKIKKPHGIKGEVLITFDISIDSFFGEDFYFIVKEGNFIPFFMVELYDIDNKTGIANFEFINSVDEAGKFSGCDLYYENDHIHENFYDASQDYKTLVGYSVVDEKIGEIGIIKQIIDMPEHVLFEVEKQKRLILIPANNEFIKQIDKKLQLVKMELPEGLLDL